MCISIDKSLLESTKLNRFEERMPSKYTNDTITQEITLSLRK